MVSFFSDNHAFSDTGAAHRVSDRDVLAAQRRNRHHAGHRGARHHPLDEDQVVEAERLLLTSHERSHASGAEVRAVTIAQGFV